MYQILFRLPNDQEVVLSKVRSKQSILDIALDNNIEIETLCGGAGVCKECIISIERGDEFFEDNIDSIAEPGRRYACQAILTDMAGELVIKIQ